MNDHELMTFWQQEEQKAFSGWDFSHLDGRWSAEPLPWDYKKLVLDYLKPSDMLLDMGTGGGEFLLTLNHPYDHTCVTEAWEPNVLLCRERLSPLGIRVHQVYDDAQQPFDDDAFDIVINRHESYDLDEVSRILKPGGLFITQQVGCDNNRELIRRLYPEQEPDPAVPGFRRTSELANFKAHGFEVFYQNEALSELRYLDVGAVVYYAKTVPWECPDFSVERCFRQLCQLHEDCVTNGFVASREHRFVLAARNNK